MDEVLDHLKSYMTSKVQSPHCLMELSTSEVKCLHNNMIILEGLSFESNLKNGSNISTYENINFGKGVHLTERVSLINGTRIKRSELNLCKRRNRVVVIVVSKAEILHASDHTIIIETSFRTDSHTNVKSGLVVLCLGVLGDRDQSDEIAWDYNLAKK